MPSLAHGRTEMAHIDNEREGRDLTRDGDGGALITQRRCAEVKRGREGLRATEPPKKGTEAISRIGSDTRPPPLALPDREGGGNTDTVMDEGVGIPSHRAGQ